MTGTSVPAAMRKAPTIYLLKLLASDQLRREYRELAQAALAELETRMTHKFETTAKELGIVLDDPVF